VRVPFGSVQVEDRKEHVVPDARPLLRRQEILGGRFEKAQGLVAIERSDVGRVYDRVDARESLLETETGRHVDSMRTSDHDDLASGSM
jgi:hypothetical protein